MVHVHSFRGEMDRRDKLLMFVLKTVRLLDQMLMLGLEESLGFVNVVGLDGLLQTRGIHRRARSRSCACTATPVRLLIPIGIEQGMGWELLMMKMKRTVASIAVESQLFDRPPLRK